MQLASCATIRSAAAAQEIVALKMAELRSNSRGFEALSTRAVVLLDAWAKVYLLIFCIFCISVYFIYFVYFVDLISFVYFVYFVFFMYFVYLYILYIL